MGPVPFDCALLFNLAELCDVLRQCFLRRLCVLALNHGADLLYDIGVRQGRHVADIPAIRDGREHAILPITSSFALTTRSMTA